MQRLTHANQVKSSWYSWIRLGLWWLWTRWEWEQENVIKRERKGGRSEKEWVEAHGGCMEWRGSGEVRLVWLKSIVFLCSLRAHTRLWHVRHVSSLIIYVEIWLFFCWPVLILNDFFYCFSVRCFVQPQLDWSETATTDVPECAVSLALFVEGVRNETVWMNVVDQGTGTVLYT